MTVLLFKILLILVNLSISNAETLVVWSNLGYVTEVLQA